MSMMCYACALHFASQIVLSAYADAVALTSIMCINSQLDLIDHLSCVVISSDRSFC